MRHIIDFIEDISLDKKYENLREVEENYYEQWEQEMI